ncbi:MAG: hypothetical protein FK733_00090, partial [Asgard group archaeon]|nr:hypothetical protein [Asgard group archaeon]
MSNDSFQILVDELGNIISGRPEAQAARFEWNVDLQNEFHGRPWEELILDSYFLGLDGILYPAWIDKLLEIEEERKKRDINLIVLLCSIGAGKTFVDSVLTWLQWFDVSTIYNPQKHFSLARNSKITFMIMSRCVTGDTIINTSKGLLPIKELAGKIKPGQAQKADFDVFNDKGWYPCEYVYNSGEQEVFEIKGDYGYKIKAPGRHKLWVLEKGDFVFKEINDIEPGDFLIAHIKQNIRGTHNAPVK